MKKWMIPLVMIMLCIASYAICEENVEWASAPVLTKAYELSAGKLYLEWEGHAPVYQVYTDGKSVAESVINNAVLNIEKGTHTIQVYPVNEKEKSADTKIDVSFSVVSFGVDLAALGLDHKNLSSGTPSIPLNIDYTPSPIFSAAPDKPSATTDAENRVILSFNDRYNADEYLITIKAGKDVNYVHFSHHAAETAACISKSNSTVRLTLDPSVLQAQGCMVPELDSKYTFSVQLRKYAADMLNGDSVHTVIHESKESGGCSYTPVAFWKTAPVITYASQTADGQVMLEWDHDDAGLGCTYAVMKVNKALIIQTGAEELGITASPSFTVNDLMNGTHHFCVIPVYKGERGESSEETAIDIRNDWVAAPALSCTPVGSNQAKLLWSSAKGVESYHITVYVGSNESLLRFVNLDYSEYASCDLPATDGEMNWLFTYEGDIIPETGVKIKFEMYGVRHTDAGEEQKTAPSNQTLILGKTSEAE